MEDFKVRNEGVKEMTGIMEQIRNEGLEAGHPEMSEAKQYSDC